VIVVVRIKTLEPAALKQESAYCSVVGQFEVMLPATAKQCAEKPFSDEEYEHGG
jgi:hypothetical protein